MNAEVKDNVLTLTIPLSPPRPSASGKTLVVASTGGFIKPGAQVDGKPIAVSLNVTVPRN